MAMASDRVCSQKQRTSDTGSPTGIPWSDTRSVICLVVITIVCLAPFAGKAFNIDDPLFLWTAKHIQRHFTDPYGFDVNWFSFTQPMFAVAMNPPIACYYIALAARVVGWGEIGLHLAFLLPAIAVTLGTFFLAKEFCKRPLEAALAAALTPVFLLSSATVMCDTLMLSFWVWSVFLWVHGLQKRSHLMLASSAFLISASALTKYYGMSLVPLLLMYSLAKERRLGLWAIYLLIPIAMLIGYDRVMHAKYAHCPFSDARQYACFSRMFAGEALPVRLLTGFSFTGGCVVTALFYLPMLWQRRALTGWIALTWLVLLTLTLAPKSEQSPLRHPLIAAEMSVFAVAGLSLIVLSLMDLLKHRDADSLLLSAWVLGTFIFASLVNWTINGRSILPMIPAAGILLMRRLDLQKVTFQVKPWLNALPLFLAGVLGLLVLRADCQFANSARMVATAINRQYNKGEATIWFQGHWGFQYYMSRFGCKAWDSDKSHAASGDIMVIPVNNSYVTIPSQAGRIKPILIVYSRYIATMDGRLGAGFYSGEWGPLPYTIGRLPIDSYYAFGVR
jgi:4-amino-4-deoxy-L-arabinose transferase-like glycosyltransferase